MEWLGDDLEDFILDLDEHVFTLLGSADAIPDG